MTTPSSAAALLSAHPLHDMWKEYVAGHERIEGERKRKRPVEFLSISIDMDRFR